MSRTTHTRLPRISSMAGRWQRAQARIATMPHTNDKFRGGFKRPGSMNVRKVGR